MKNKEKWRLIIQEAKAHRAVAPRGRKEGRKNIYLILSTQLILDNVYSFLIIL
jgi:hypothetical protein